MAARPRAWIRACARRWFGGPLVGSATALLLGGGFLWACYGPKISPGLRCATPPAMACPDGFVCVSEVCLPQGSSAALGGAGGGAAGAGGDAGTGGGLATDVGGAGVGGAGGEGGGGGGGDDIAGAGGVGGAAGGGQPGTRTLGQTCLASVTGTVGAASDCADGLECVGDCGAGKSARCFRLCASDADCPDSACSRMAPATGHPICEIAYSTCDPTVPAASGCPGAAERCYLLSSATSLAGGPATVCDDCSLDALGAGTPCSDSRSCAPGLVCPPQGSVAVGSGFCRHLCDPTMGNAGCQSGQACRAFGPKWGYCF
jgi:hypothetical protein